MDSGAQELLEIFIITYNRSTHLDNTLRQLVGCPFTKFPITILDNCSEDDTYDIFSKYQSQFPRLNYIKNKINIGADANVLRAAELSDGRYTWILCDDDSYDFSICNDVLSELAKGEVAAIMVGWSNEFVWPTNSMYNRPTNLLKNDFPYFSVPTFVPGSIFKTELFQDQIRNSYANIVNLLPVMTYYINLYESDNAVYVSKKKIVAATGQGGYDYSFLRVMFAVVNTFYLIKPQEVRRKAFYDSYLKPSFIKVIKHTLLMSDPKNNVLFLLKYKYYNLLTWDLKIIYLIIYCISPFLNSSYFSKYITKLIAKFKRKRLSSLAS